MGYLWRLKPGDKVALVGASGPGKSTLASLLLAFMKPDKGNIYINGISLSDIKLEDWLSHVAFVPQAPHLFYRSVADNIRLGRKAATLNEVVEAAKHAGAHEFIISLPESYDTLVGEGRDTDYSSLDWIRSYGGNFGASNRSNCRKGQTIRTNRKKRTLFVIMEFAE